MLIISGIAWMIAIGVGMWKLWDYANSPGISTAPPVRWPDDSQIRRVPGRATLVMLAHPRCPCTRASIGELAVLMTSCQDKLTAYVLFLKPKNFPDDWARTDSWYSAASIPGVSVVQDSDGIEARRFHAATSGETVLYDTDGRLLFSGGITAARGHSGDNAGRSAIVSLLSDSRGEYAETSVFGCSLFDESSQCGEGANLCEK